VPITPVSQIRVELRIERLRASGWRREGACDRCLEDLLSEGEGAVYRSQACRACYEEGQSLNMTFGSGEVQP